MASPKVFVDANVLKFSATAVRSWEPLDEFVERARAEGSAFRRVVEVNPNDSIKNPQLRSEAELLPRLAAAGQSGLVDYRITFELQAEGWRLPNMPPKTQWFYGTPLTKVEAPFRYARTYAGGRRTPKELQHRFLASVKHPRFLEIQKVVGAYQGVQFPQRNQLLDAFHLWCAEHNGCQYFLTLDFKLARLAERQRSKLAVAVVRPSELLLAIEQGTSEAEAPNPSIERTFLSRLRRLWNAAHVER